jgi:Pyridoxamine 5'-phosphate oxidase
VVTDSEPINVNEVFAGGVAIVAATVGEHGQPAITRGWGPLYDAAKQTLTISLTAPAGSATLSNLEANGAIAVTASQPLSYRTVQLKGVVEHVEAPSEADRIRAHEHLDQFVSDVAQLGIASGADNLFLGDLRLVIIQAREVFDQTPGSNAGRQLN